MMSKRNVGRWLGVFLGISYGALITNSLHEFVPGLQMGIVSLVFLGLGLGFYFLGIWLVVERPAELNKKFPVSRKELRRQRKEFYESLGHQDNFK